MPSKSCSACSFLRPLWAFQNHPDGKCHTLNQNVHIVLIMPLRLVLKGRDDEALHVLAALSDLPEDDPKIQSEFKAVKDVAFEMAKGGFRQCFETNRNRNLHRTILGYVNQMFQQISGINIITYYAATLFKDRIGLSGFLSRLLAACNGTEYFMASWIAIFTIEKFGRRQLMLFGAAGQAASMAILAATTSQAVGAQKTQYGIAAAVFLFVFNSFFAVGWLGMTWLVLCLDQQGYVPLT